MKNYSLRYSVAAPLLALLCILCANAYAQQPGPAALAASKSSADAAIPAAQLLQPSELVQILRASGGEKPLVLQVVRMSSTPRHIYLDRSTLAREDRTQDSRHSEIA
jgi:hypothetical protein